jgi:hypothetical protein
MKTHKTSEAQRARARAYYAENKERRLAYAAQYRELNRDEIRAYFRSEAARKRKNAKRVEWNAANRDRQREINVKAHLKRYHGLTPEDYARMLDAQNGVCAICEEPPQGKKHCGKLHVDHDHATGVIRALLCADCNRAIGLFRESPARARKAALYLERHQANRRSA